MGGINTELFHWLQFQHSAWAVTNHLRATFTHLGRKSTKTQTVLIIIVCSVVIKPCWNCILLSSNEYVSPHSVNITQMCIDKDTQASFIKELSECHLTVTEQTRWEGAKMKTMTDRQCPKVLTGRKVLTRRKFACSLRLVDECPRWLMTTEKSSWI